MRGPEPGVEPTCAENRESEDRYPAPRLYVASLSDYNAGILHGGWLAVDGDAEELHARIDTMLATSPTTTRYGDVAEDWAIHDYEGWGALHLGEFESIDYLVAMAEGLRQHGLAFAAWVDHTGNSDAATMAEFADHYQGEFDDLEDYGNQVLDDCGLSLVSPEHIPESFRNYLRIDVAAFVHDLVAGGDIYSVESSEGIYVFNN